MPAFDDFIEVVTEMMDNFGGTGTLVSNGPAVYDPATGVAVGSPYNFPVRILAFDYLQKKDGYSGMANSLIKSGDKQVYMQSGALIPLPNAKTDKIIWQGVTFSIVTVKSLNPSGSTVVVTEMFIRE